MREWFIWLKKYNMTTTIKRPKTLLRKIRCARNHISSVLHNYEHKKNQGIFRAETWKKVARKDHVMGTLQKNDIEAKKDLTRIQKGVIIQVVEWEYRRGKKCKERTDF